MTSAASAAEYSIQVQGAPLHGAVTGSQERKQQVGAGQGSGSGLPHPTSLLSHAESWWGILAGPTGFLSQYGYR